MLSLGPNRTPWKHQVEIFEWAKDRPAAGLLMGMGTGKTGLTVNLFEHNFSEGRITKALVLVPVRYADTWVEEYHRCFPDRVVVNLLRNKEGRLVGKEGRLANLNVPGDVYICNYESLGTMETLGRHRRFSLTELGQAIHKRMKAEPFGVACDESTHIKNPRSTRGKAVCELGELAKVRYILTGTPLSQGPEDAFGQYLFLDPTVFGHRFTLFRSRFLQMGGYMGKEIQGLQPAKAEEFNRLLYSISKRVTKEDCMDLPPKVYHTLTYDLDRKTQKIYDELRDVWLVEMQDKQFAVTNGLTKSLRLAQICTGFLGSREANEDGKIETVTIDCDEKVKLDTLLEIIEETPGKIIVWCKWVKNVRDIMLRLDGRHIGAVDYYSGSIDAHANELAFRNDPAIRVFCGTGESGGMGLNLQGPEVKTVIYFSQDYKGIIREQSEDRAHRGDIRHTVNIIDMVAKGTIEEAIVKALREKIDVQKWILQHPDEFVRGQIREVA